MAGGVLPAAGPLAAFAGAAILFGLVASGGGTFPFSSALPGLEIKGCMPTGPGGILRCCSFLGGWSAGADWVGVLCAARHKTETAPRAKHRTVFIGKSPRDVVFCHAVNILNNLRVSTIVQHW